MTNEKEREEAYRLAAKIGALSPLSCSDPGCLACLEHRNDAVVILLNYRAEAVKAERERCIVETMQLLVTSGQITNSEIYNGFRARLSAILNADQEAPKEDEPGREETLQEYLGRQDGADIDLEHGSN